MKWCALSLSLVLFLSSSAHAWILSDPTAKANAIESAAKIKTSDSYFSAHAEEYVSVFKALEKKRRQGFTPAPVYECDLTEKCRPGYQVLFRGEDEKHSYPGTSGLMRTLLKNEYVSTADDSSMLKKFSTDIAFIGPSNYPPQSEDLILIQKDQRRKWVYKQDLSMDYNSFFNAKEAELTQIQLLVGFHVEASSLYYQNEKRQALALDPIISFSSNPMQAIAFARANNVERKGWGRLIMISVPETSILKNCKTIQLPKPGTVIDANECTTTNEYSEELEFDVFLSIQPKDLFQFKP